MGALALVQKYFPFVSSVVDGTEPVQIEVTGSDVEHSDVRSHKTCAMAIACKRSLNLDGALVSLTAAYMIQGTQAVRFSLPPSVSREIVTFDRMGKKGFLPGIYSLSVVPKTRRLGSAYHSNSKKAKGTKRKVVVRHRTEGVRTILGAIGVS